MITPPEPFVPKLTEPESPLLHQSRPRPKTFLSREEEEAKIMAEIQPFKARPLNQKAGTFVFGRRMPVNIMLTRSPFVQVLHSSGDLGVPKVPKPKLTEAVGFNFRTEQRAKLHPTSQQVEENDAATRPVSNSTGSSGGQRGITVVSYNPGVAASTRVLMSWFSFSRSLRLY